MSENKRYYFLQMPEDFFSSKRIKRLRNLAGGDTYTIIYLKMQLKAMNNQGVLVYDGIMESVAEEIAIDIDEKADDVQMTMNYLQSCGLLEIRDTGDCYLPYAEVNVGSITASSIRSRESRANKSVAMKPEAKTNAERQLSFRAKQLCKEDGHVPYIEDYMNKKRYNGNYYICFKRDKCQCAICGSKQQLCMHHIDGYDENKPQNSEKNKMITLCRECHSQVHAGKEIPKTILESIDYYEDCNESNDFCNTLATNCNGDIDIDIEIKKIVSKDTICQTQNVQQVVNEWNTLDKFGIKPISKLASTSTRYKQLVARMKQYSLDDVLKAIDNIRHSDYLQGKVNQWQITFDWFVKPNNFPKVLEGNYNNKSKGTTPNRPKLSPEELRKVALGE